MAETCDAREVVHVARSSNEGFMIECRPDGKVEFRFFRPDASSVHIAGDFNAWQTAATPMTRHEDGWWTAELYLPAGEYRFRYVSDRGWFTDYAAHGIEYCRRGCNSMLLVGHSAARKAA
jgi:1,4-alpha-glucan branching enzyme